MNADWKDHRPIPMRDEKALLNAAQAQASSKRIGKVFRPLTSELSTDFGSPSSATDRIRGSISYNKMRIAILA